MPKELETESPVSGEFRDTEKAIEWERYERWRKLKRRDMRIGVYGMVGAITLRLLLALAIPAPANDTVNALDLLAWFVAAGLMLWGAYSVCRSKGRNGLFCLLGVFTLLLGDRNRREAPNRPGTGEKPAGAMFSDW